MLLSSGLGSNAFAQLGFATIGIPTPPTPPPFFPTPPSRTFDAGQCSPINIYITPDELIDYALLWTSQLADGEEISSSVLTSLGPDVIDPPAYIHSDGQGISFWLSIGTAIVGNSYPVTDYVVTTGGRKLERTLMIFVNSSNTGGNCEC